MKYPAVRQKVKVSLWTVGQLALFSFARCARDQVGEAEAMSEHVLENLSFRTSEGLYFYPGH